MVLRDKIKNAEEFTNFVLVPEEYRQKSWIVLQKLGVFGDEDYVILHHLYHPDDGQWHSSSYNFPLFVVFRNEEDAVAFKVLL